MKLRFTKRASTQIDKALGYIAQRSPTGADRVRKQIQLTALLLLGHPFAGHETTGKGVRRIVVGTFPFVLFYRIKGDEIVIQRLFHTSRNPTQTFEKF